MDAITAIDEGSSQNARAAAELQMALMREVIFTAQAAALALIARTPEIPATAPISEGRGAALDFYA